jgi:hypothetical protein
LQLLTICFNSSCPHGIYSGKTLSEKVEKDRRLALGTSQVGTSRRLNFPLTLAYYYSKKGMNSIGREPLSKPMLAICSDTPSTTGSQFEKKIMKGDVHSRIRFQKVSGHLFTKLLPS